MFDRINDKITRVAVLAAATLLTPAQPAAQEVQKPQAEAAPSRPSVHDYHPLWVTIKFLPTASTRQPADLIFNAPDFYAMMCQFPIDPNDSSWPAYDYTTSRMFGGSSQGSSIMQTLHGWQEAMEDIVDDKALKVHTICADNQLVRGQLGLEFRRERDHLRPPPEAAQTAKGCLSPMESKKPQNAACKLNQDQMQSYYKQLDDLQVTYTKLYRERVTENFKRQFPDELAIDITAGVFLFRTAPRSPAPQ